MPEETVGYVRLQWTCRQCGTVNPGPEKKCQGCGAAQPEDQIFELPEQQELVRSEAELKRAMTGPDVHCGFCGARNPGDSKLCAQCGAPLSEGVSRQKTGLMGAAQLDARPEIACPFCGAMNPAKSTKCKSCGGGLAGSKPIPPAASKQIGKATKGLGAAAIVAIVLACVAVIGGVVFLSQTSEQTGIVKETKWEQRVAIEELGPVTHEDWYDDIPSGVQIGNCVDKYRYTSSSPVPGAKKVCGTAYVKDEGQGYGKMVQDCEYQVYDDWCEYTVNEWRVIRTEKTSGNDLLPYWPAIMLGANQREGKRSGVYEVVFLSNDKTYTYQISDFDSFRQYEPGTKWRLTVSKLGAITNVER